MSQLDRGSATRIMYLELKSGSADNGPARIGRVSFSKTRRTIYYGGKAFQRAKGGGISANYFDVETGEEHWISGVKKDRRDRHWAGSGKVEIDEDVREEYRALLGGHPGPVQGADSPASARRRS